MATYPTKLYTIRREGRTWIVLGIHEREHANSFSLDCVADNGERQDFTTGAKGLAALREIPVTITAEDS